MKTTFHQIERNGHIDLFFMGSCRVSLLPKAPKIHSCDDEVCSHTSDESETSTPTYAKLFIRQSFRTHMIDIPADYKINPEDFVNVFTCPYDALPEYVTTGNTEEQWLAEIRIEYLGSLDPIQSSE